ncbi:unnamed protein product, partial [Ectocarpus sp. 12 AP-2014]
MSNPFTPDPDLAAKIASGSGRIESIEHQERTLWVKRPEKLHGKLRLYKGDPAKAFRAEQEAVQRFADKGLPIAPLVAVGDGFIAFEDAGEPLKNLLRFEDHTLEERIAMMEGAATALAAFHASGISHGRPNLKDILWQNGKARFIDFERASRARDTAKGHAEDVILFFFSAFAELDNSSVEIEAARKAYIAAGGAAFWDLAVARMARFKW